MLVEKTHGAVRIVALDRMAAKSNLRPGMSLAEARTWMPDLRVAEADPQADGAFLLRLASACERFTPLVALRENDGFILDITGCVHLFGGEKGLGRDACRLMIRMGASPRSAIAGTPDAAWAFARFTQGGGFARNEEEASARTLPVAALELDTESALALARAGFRTIGDIADRPSHLLTARFGNNLIAKLMRVLGREDIRITPLRSLPLIVAEQHFPEPLAHVESLLGVLERLARDVSIRLEQRGAGGRSFEASFFRSDGIVRRISIETAQGTRDPAMLMRLLKLRIEVLADPLDPGFGFDAVRLSLLRSEALQERQKVLGGEPLPGDAESGIAALVDRLVVRFGRENVLRFVTCDTHDPVRAGGMIPYLSPGPSDPWSEPAPGQPPARPLTLFSHPHQIEVLAEVPDSPPLRFRWRRVLHEVRLAEGPERIAPEWWRETASGNDHTPATRDYYRVEDADGHRFWIFREGFYDDTNARPRWFLHGLFA